MRSNRKLIAVFLALMALMIGVALLRPRTEPPSPLPSPNGYDELVKAAALLTPVRGGYDALDESGLRAIVSSNAPALRQVRLALAMASRVPPVTQASLSNRLAELSSIKAVALNFAAEGRLHEMDDQPAHAARSYLDCLRTGLTVSRGGVVISRLVGIACEGIGSKGLRQVMPKLDVSAGRVASQAIGDLLAGSDTAEQTLAEERRYWRTASGLGEVIFAPIFRRNAEQAVAGATAKIKQHQQQLGQLAVGLATRAFELEHHSKPRSWDDLVPHYLMAIPHDPVTGGPLAFGHAGELASPP